MSRPNARAFSRSAHRHRHRNLSRRGHFPLQAYDFLYYLPLKSGGGPKHSMRNSAPEQGHHAVVRSVAFKLMRIYYRCWKDRKCYDAAAYKAALKKHGSPLAKLLRLPISHSNSLQIFRTKNEGQKANSRRRGKD